MITLIGMGSGTPGSLTAQGLAALQGADRILGAKRLLATLPEAAPETGRPCTNRTKFWPVWPRTRTRKLRWCTAAIPGSTPAHPSCCPCCGPLASPAGCWPGLSSVQLLAAAVGRSWQEWKLVSAHGCACDPVAECLTAGGKPVFFLTGGAETPASLCGRLAAAGLGDAHVLVGEELGRAEEKILFGTAQEFAQKQFASLSVLLVEHLPQPTGGCPASRMKLSTGERCHDQAGGAGGGAGQAGRAARRYPVGCGAGTGSVSVELALAAPRGHVYAVECDPEACGLIRQNRETFHACNLTLVEAAPPLRWLTCPPRMPCSSAGPRGAWRLWWTRCLPGIRTPASASLPLRWKR